MEIGPSVAIELDSNPEQVFAAYVAPVLKAVLRAKSIGGESQHSFLSVTSGDEIAMQSSQFVIAPQLVMCARCLLLAASHVPGCRLVRTDRGPIALAMAVAIGADIAWSGPCHMHISRKHRCDLALHEDQPRNPNMPGRMPPDASGRNKHSTPAAVRRALNASSLGRR